jgi:hypothetical protein
MFGVICSFGLFTLAKQDIEQNENTIHSSNEGEVEKE